MKIESLHCCFTSQRIFCLAFLDIEEQLCCAFVGELLSRPSDWPLKADRLMSLDSLYIPGPGEDLDLYLDLPG